MTSNFLSFGLSTLHSSLWTTDKTIFAKSNNPQPPNKTPASFKLPLKRVSSEIGNHPWGGGGEGRKLCNRNVCKELKDAFGEICY